MIVLFVHFTTWEGQIFEGIKKIIKPDGKLYKPIYGCPVCMTPWWGTAIYLLFSPTTSLKEWFLTIGLACGFSVLIVCFLTIRDAMNSLNDKLEREEEMLKRLEAQRRFRERVKQTMKKDF